MHTHTHFTCACMYINRKSCGTGCPTRAVASAGPLRTYTNTSVHARYRARLLFGLSDANIQVCLTDSFAVRTATCHAQSRNSIESIQHDPATDQSSPACSCSISKSFLGHGLTRSKRMRPHDKGRGLAHNWPQFSKEAFPAASAHADLTNIPVLGCGMQ